MMTPNEKRLIKMSIECLSRANSHLFPDPEKESADKIIKDSITAKHWIAEARDALVELIE